MGRRQGNDAPLTRPAEISLAPGTVGAILKSLIAGWSSPVARQAHNLKVVGSNPTPATNFLDAMYQVYVLVNDGGQRYIGLSANVSVRVQQHNEGLSRWTKGKGPWSRVWTSEAMALSEARKLENALKRQKGGDGLARLLAAHNPAAAGS